MTIGYLPGEGVLHRAHPFTVLTLGLGVAILAFLLPRPIGPVVLLAVTVGLTLVAGAWRVLPAAALVSAPFWLFLSLIHGVFRADPATAVGLAARISAMIVAFLLVLAVVHPGRLIEALLARGAPFGISYLLVAALQAVPRLRERGAAILDAQRCRGLRVRGSLVKRARAITALAIPLVLGALAEVDDRTLALEARGAGSDRRRTPLHPPADTVFDRATRWLVAVAVVLAFWMAVR